MFKDVIAKNPKAYLSLTGLGTVAMKKKDIEAGGSGEIRTHERLPVAGFQDRCNRPLCHASCTCGLSLAILTSFNAQVF